jgi:glycine/D-amino acid oxidase-like deaminating enzyme
MSPDVIVVGGGIAGTTVAWELARRGTSVELLEQATLAAGASGRNTATLLHQVEPVVAAMLRESEERYRELQDGDVDFRWTSREELLLARDPAQLRVVEEKAAVMAQQGVGRGRETGAAGRSRGRPRRPARRRVLPPVPPPRRRCVHRRVAVDLAARRGRGDRRAAAHGSTRARGWHPGSPRASASRARGGAFAR